MYCDSVSCLRVQPAAMSFGFSVGDFLAVINLATQIRKQFSDAPKHFRDISDEVKSLSATLFDLAGDDDGFLHALEPIQADHLRTILEASHHVLKDLESLLASECHLTFRLHVNLECHVKMKMLSTVHPPNQTYRVRRLRAWASASREATSKKTMGSPYL